MGNQMLLTQLAHAKLKNAFGGWLRKKGFADSAPEDLARGRSIRIASKFRMMAS